MLGRRLLILAAALLGLAAVTTSFAPRESASDRPRAPLPTQQADPGAGIAPDEDPSSDVKVVTDVVDEPPLHELSAQASGQRVEVQAGRRIRLAVGSTGLGSAQIGADGPTEAIDPRTPARFDLLYETPMRLAILARDATGSAPRTIGRLDVVPAG